MKSTPTNQPPAAGKHERTRTWPTGAHPPRREALHDGREAELYSDGAFFPAGEICLLEWEAQKPFREADLCLLEVCLSLVELRLRSSEVCLPLMELRLRSLEVRLPLMELCLHFLEVRLPLVELRLQALEVRLRLVELCLQALEVRLHGLVFHLRGLFRRLRAFFHRLRAVCLTLAARRGRLHPPPHLLMRPFYWDTTEIDPYTGNPYTWDSPDPNVTFDGILEPGDPGYVMPPSQPPPSSKPRKLKSTMKRNSFYPTNIPEQMLWLTNFAHKLGLHAASLGISVAVCAAIVADARWLIYLLGAYQPARKAWAKSCTDVIREAQTGTGDTVMTLPAFVPPPLPGADAGAGLPAVVPVKPGALNRIFSLVQVMQEAPGYGEAVATDLGTVGTELEVPDLTQARPQFTVAIVNGQVFLDWGWGGLRSFVDMLQIQVDRGTGWVDLAYDTTPGYTDTTPLPATPTRWKYRAIWRVDDAPVGLWSEEMSLNVG